MTKRFFFLLLFLACSMAAFTQDKKMAVGIGAEWNMDSRRDFAGGGILVFDYKLPRFVSLGVMIEGSSNFSGTHVIEPAFLFRAYYLENEYRGFYFQTDLGASFIMEPESEPEREPNRDVWIRPIVGFGVGYRAFLGPVFYVEPFGRLGFPFAFGLGMIAGLRF